MSFTITPDIRLEFIAQKHAHSLFDVVDANREHLARFLPWVGSMRSTGDFKNYITICEQLSAQRKEVSFVIFYQNMLAGRIGLHHINHLNKTGAIGYWLSREAEGKGIMLHCCRRIIDYGFQELGLNRIEIKAATENYRSIAIPEKLQFTREGILRESELVNGEYLNLIVYSMLQKEWSK